MITNDVFQEIINKVRRRESFSPTYKTVTYDLSTAPASEEVLNLAGGYLQILDATDTLANVKIRFNESANDQITLRKGDAIITPFFRLFITWPAQASKTLTLAISPDFDLWRIDRSAQVISTIDSITNPVSIVSGQVISAKDFWADRAIAGEIYELGAFVAGVAAQYSHVQLKNPAASGKTAVLINVGLAQDGGGAVTVYGTQANTDLTTDVAALSNVSVGAAAAASHLRTQNNAALLGMNTIFTGRFGAGTNIQHFSRYDVLGAGEGILFVAATVNIGLFCNFRIWEF